MAKWFKDYLSFGSRRSPPQPPKPDYTESEILKAYRAQKSLDFEDPYEDGNGKLDPDSEGSPNKGYGSPKHRLIKVEASDLNRTKALLAAEDVTTQPDQVSFLYRLPCSSPRWWSIKKPIKTPNKNLGTVVYPKLQFPASLTSVKKTDI
uniref:Src homology 2 domain containing transforming protein D n=1 Tax=Podarcis muralis TaxID=64176 RepID=A0A670K8D6_PODMU